MNCNYSQNEIKICENSQIVLFQSVELELILKTYNELLELIELFSENASDNKLTTLLTKKKIIEKKSYCRVLPLCKTMVTYYLDTDE